jgi:hypothetical protein
MNPRASAVMPYMQGSLPWLVTVSPFFTSTLTNVPEP